MTFQNWFICSSIRNWIAYANEDKYCKQGFPYRLSYLDKPEDEDFNDRSLTGRHHCVILEPSLSTSGIEQSRAQSSPAPRSAVGSRGGMYFKYAY